MGVAFHLLAYEVLDYQDLTQITVRDVETYGLIFLASWLAQLNITIPSEEALAESTQTLTEADGCLLPSVGLCHLSLERDGDYYTIWRTCVTDGTGSLGRGLLFGKILVDKRATMLFNVFDYGDDSPIFKIFDDETLLDNVLYKTIISTDLSHDLKHADRRQRSVRQAADQLPRPMSVTLYPRHMLHPCPMHVTLRFRRHAMYQRLRSTSNPNPMYVTLHPRHTLHFPSLRNAPKDKQNSERLVLGTKTKETQPRKTRLLPQGIIRRRRHVRGRKQSGATGSGASPSGATCFGAPCSGAPRQFGFLHRLRRGGSTTTMSIPRKPADAKTSSSSTTSIPLRAYRLLDPMNSQSKARPGPLWLLVTIMQPAILRLAWIREAITVEELPVHARELASLLISSTAGTWTTNATKTWAPCEHQSPFIVPTLLLGHSGDSRRRKVTAATRSTRCTLVWLLELQKVTSKKGRQRSFLQKSTASASSATFPLPTVMQESVGTLLTHVSSRLLGKIQETPRQRGL